ncbi:hypothetical protein OIDMADRAFT_143177 [Oidiodendron maius Zn]|uniref:Uncharacterized protein n=1 Tax=Oidiodendron maius (strain Zn) TaxID=913774 RepID=A0A0C3HMX5_OIDMZ|nr:hypothetical protein OIDMADRAFT_143177 [Oidiodendron maius Zn]
MAASTHSQRVWETVLLAENSPADNSLITTRYKEMLQGNSQLQSSTKKCRFDRLLHC